MHILEGIILFSICFGGQETASEGKTSQSQPGKMNWRHRQPPPPPPPATRWHGFQPLHRSRLRHAYHNMRHHFSDRDLQHYKRMRQEYNYPEFKKIPSHWCRFIVKITHWSKQQLKELPLKEQARLNKLPEEKKIEELRKILKPLFLKKAAQFKATTEKVFSPLELYYLRRLPPKLRIEILEKSKHNAFNLISQWSWDRFQALGEQKKLVIEYLTIPSALLSSWDEKRASFLHVNRRSKRQDMEKKQPEERGHQRKNLPLPPPPGPDNMKRPPGPDNMKRPPGPDGMKRPPGQDNMKRSPGPDNMKRKQEEAFNAKTFLDSLLY